jgi:hypothetical protein
MSWTNQVHMEQLAWTLCHDIVQGRMGGGYHFAMPTRSTNQILLEFQPRQSSDQAKLTQVCQQVKTQVTQPPMPFPKLCRNTRNKPKKRAKRLRKSTLKI